MSNEIHSAIEEAIRFADGRGMRLLGLVLGGPDSATVRAQVVEALRRKGHDGVKVRFEEDTPELGLIAVEVAR